MDTVEVEGMLHIWSCSYCVLQQTMFPLWHTNKQFFSFVRQESHSTTLVACIILWFEPWVTNRNGHRNSKQRENSSNGNKLHGHIAIIAKLSPHYVLTKFTISSLWPSNDARLVLIFLHSYKIKSGNGLGTKLVILFFCKKKKRFPNLRINLKLAIAQATNTSE